MEAKKTTSPAAPVPHHTPSDKVKNKSGTTPLSATHPPDHAGSLQPSGPLPATHAPSQASTHPAGSHVSTPPLSPVAAQEEHQQQQQHQATAAAGQQRQQEPLGKAPLASVAGLASIMATYAAAGRSQVGAQPSDVHEKTVCRIVWGFVAFGVSERILEEAMRGGGKLACD